MIARTCIRCAAPAAPGPRRLYCLECRAELRLASKRKNDVKQQAKRRGPCERCGAPKSPGRKHYCDACAELASQRAAELATQRGKPCRRCGGDKPPGAVFLCAPCVGLAAEEAAVKRLSPNRCQRCDGSRAYGRTRYCDPCAKVVESERFHAYAEAKRKACTQCGSPKGKHRILYCEPCAQEAAVARREKLRAWAQANPEVQRMQVSKRRARIAQAFVEDVSPLIVLERDDGVCGICDCDVDPFNFHVDHIVPLARGGEHSYANVQVAHPACNIAKGTRVLEEV